MIGLLLITAAGAAPASWTAMSNGERVAALHTIADQCGLPRKSFSVNKSGEWHMRPPRTASYEAVDCGLRNIRDVLGLQRMGFVGNESSEPEKK